MVFDLWCLIFDLLQVEDARRRLEEAWIARRNVLDQCLELQLYYRFVDF